jgi:hypothetical protein
LLDNVYCSINPSARCDRADENGQRLAECFDEMLVEGAIMQGRTLGDAALLR